jgi:indole-3-glycerol phosphate synthase
MESVLSRILATKVQEVSLIGDILPSRKFPAPTRITKTNKFQIIAEIKPKSPSQGKVLGDKGLITLAKSYAEFACTISVLTDNEYFGGSLQLMSEIKGVVEVPVLRKDFVVSTKQVIEAYNHGADLVLVIIRIIDYKALIVILNKCIELNLQPLIEVFDLYDIQSAKRAITELNMTAESYIIGVNNRNLDTLEMFLDNSKNLFEQLPLDSIKFSLSGISTSKQIEELVNIGYDGALIGYGLTQNPFL